MTTDGPTPSDRWAPPGGETIGPPPAAPPPGPSPPAARSGYTAPQPPAATAPQWRSVHGLGVALQVLIWVGLATNVVLLVALANESDKVGEFETTFLPVDELEDAIDLVDRIFTVGVFLGIAVFVLFVIFCYRGAKNIEMLGRYQPALATGWAIGAWFIPVAAPILVGIVFAGIWKGSDPTVPPGAPDWKRAPLTPLLVLWLVAYYVGATTLSVGRSAFTNDAGEFETVSDIRSANTASLVGGVLLLAGIVLAALFVRRLTQRFDIWGEHLGFQGPAAMPYATPPTPGPTPYQASSNPPGASDESFARRDEPRPDPPPDPLS